MKRLTKIKWVCAMLFVSLLCGCNDWLDVNPRQEMKESVAYSTEDGFKSVLTGVYIRLATTNLYGFNTSMYLPEIMARNWKLPESGFLYELANFNYEYSEVESRFETIYQQYYSSIAHLNNLLAALANSTDVHFTYDNDKLMKGEALGLRAFLHFELLRYFGPVPAEANPGAKTIPYVTEMTKDPNVLVALSWSEVVKHIEDDLTAAEELLKGIDPITKAKNIYLNRSVNVAIPANDQALLPEDDWQYYRQNRFNYYAVLGTKARFYHWVGNKEAEAVKYAKMVIEAKDNDDSNKFKLTSEVDYVNRVEGGALVFASEHLFAVHNPNILSTINSYFIESTATIQQDSTLVIAAFESLVHQNDIRIRPRRYWETKRYEGNVSVNHFYKYAGNEIGNLPSYTVPLLRLAEMYFIVMENSTVSEANDYFETFRIARNMLDYNILFSDKADVEKRLEKEYRKDFYGEGQMFFFYKRHQYTICTWPGITPDAAPSFSFVVPDGAYVVPLPKSQIAFE